MPKPSGYIDLTPLKFDVLFLTGGENARSILPRSFNIFTRLVEERSERTTRMPWPGVSSVVFIVAGTPNLVR